MNVNFVSVLMLYPHFYFNLKLENSYSLKKVIYHRSLVCWQMFQNSSAGKKGWRELTSGAPIQCHQNHYSSHKNGCDGCHANATLQKRWEQPVVRGNREMAGLSIKQGLKSKFGGQGKQHGEVHTVYR